MACNLVSLEAESITLKLLIGVIYSQSVLLKVGYIIQKDHEKALRLLKTQTVFGGEIKKLNIENTKK